MRRLGLILLIAVSCSSPPPPPPPAPPAPPPVAPPAPPPAIPADFAFEISSGGGVTGARRTLGMKAGGQTWGADSGRQGLRVEGPVLDEATRLKVWGLVAPPKMEALGCRPGNMTDSVQVTANGVTFSACSGDGKNLGAAGLYGDVSNFLEPARKALADAAPPRPAVLVLELVRGKRTTRVAHAATGFTVPKGPWLVEEAKAQALWEQFFRAHVAWLDPEILNGKRLAPAAKGCPKDGTLLRVRSDGSKTPFYVRQGCSGAKPNPEELVLFDLIESAAKP